MKTNKTEIGLQRQIKIELKTGGIWNCTFFLISNLSVFKMNSTSTSSLPTFSTNLAHSYNSRGELGAYVNPYACSCTTCENYVADHGEDAAVLPPAPTSPLQRQTAVGVASFISPSALLGLAPSSSTASIPPAVRLQRAPANHVWGDDGWVHQDSPAGQAIVNGSSTTTTSSSSSVRGAGTGLSFSMGLGLSSNTVPSLSMTRLPPPAEEDQVMDQLRSLRSTLQLRQDDVYRGCDSHSDMAAADQEFDELDRKIMAIEQCMLTFGAIFRTR
jgi:hypothetical protein